MNALQYDFSIPNYLRVRAADRLPLRHLEKGLVPGLSEIEQEPLELPGPDWIRVKPILAGICGSDISMLTNRAGPSLMPFASFPVVPGHEVVGEVVESGEGASTIETGRRVVISPLISCEMRGMVPCPSCASGEPGLCVQSAEGDLAPGMLTGFCRDLPGGWSREMVAHKSQVVPIPDLISNQTAVLIEPFSVALHSVLRNPPEQDSEVLIIGGGSIGLLVLAALRMVGHDCPVSIITRHGFQAEAARKLGATNVLESTSPGEAATQIAGARRYQPLRGPAVYAGGFDWVFDCVGSSRSVDDSLRVAGPHGRIVMVGCVAEVGKIDFSFVWARELQITGSYVYGSETQLDGAPHTFDVAMRLIEMNPDVQLSDLVTHIFPLEQWQPAMSVVFNRGANEAIKVAFDCA